jgi:NADPH:quinone reductase-like Zn-dependent oxidoreductase
MLRMGQSMRGYLVFEITSDAARLARARAFIEDGFAAGCFSAAIDSTFPFERIADAHRYIESNRQFGKVVVTVP